MADQRQWTSNINLMHQTTLDLPPSCLEYLPKPSERAGVFSHLQDHYHEYFVVGTYHLEKNEGTEVVVNIEDQDGQLGDSLLAPAKSQSKNGSLVLFRYHKESLKLLQTLPYPSAVFDLHFLPAQPLFAIVSSTGTIALFKIVESLEVTSPVSNDTGLVKIENIAIHQVFTGDIAPTFFTWAPHSQHLMAISTSDGGVYLVRFSAEYQSFDILNNGNPVTRHSEYAWCCSFSGSGDRLFSGGDDNKLRLENLDTALSASNPEYSIVPSELHPKGLSGHDAGVTFILPIPLPEVEGKTQLLLTGSYDDHIRILAIPPYPSRPKILTELHLGGGVWRLRFVESSPGLTNNGIDRIFKYTVLASCMHAGAKILSITGIKQHSGDSLDWDWKIKVLAEMNLHKSMNYASDIQTIHCTKGIDHPRTRLCVSSSFYDRLLCVWDWDQGEDS